MGEADIQLLEKRDMVIEMFYGVREVLRTYDQGFDSVNVRDYQEECVIKVAVVLVLF